MKKLLVSLMLAITAFSMIAEASARPMGGGRSFGRQSPAVARRVAPPAASPYQRPAAAPAPAPYQAPGMTPPRPSMWKGVLGGALLGLGAGALMSHFGMGGAMASGLSSILMLVLLAMAAMFIYRMFARRKETPAPSAFQGYSNPLPAGGGTPEIGSGISPSPFQPVQQPASSYLDKPVAEAPWGVPTDFDAATFLRHAKASFIRMQAAWDKADTNDLREFTTPEVYAELKMQIQERGATPDFTDVVTIDGELLGIETIGSEYLASVKFTGMIRTAPNAPAEPFSEVWNMSKPVSGSGGWVLAGIQQLS